ncbi:MAG: helix-turn-helix domain-containing protein [Ruminiclostridium sp.]|nr:helix-turn-helix domain-containing protein [Ruminiclostridium sp.]
MTVLSKNKTFYKWLSSYVIISGVIVTILGLIVFTRTSSVIDRQTVEIYGSMIEKDSMYYDSRLNRIRELGVKFSSLPWAVKAMGANRDLGEVFDIIQLNEITQEINYYKAIDNLIYSISLLFPSSGNVIDASSKGNISDYFTDSMSFDTKTMDKINNDMRTYNYFNVLEPTEVTIYSNSYSVIPIIQSVQYNIGMPKGTLFILINESTLLKSMADRRVDNSKTFILYNNGTILADKGIVDGINKKLLDRISESRKEIDSISYGNDFAYIVQSGIAPWKYVYVFPKNDMMANRRLNATFIIISAVVVLFVGILLSLYFTAKSYNPLLKLLKAIGAAIPEPEQVSVIKKQSEFQIIENTVGRLSKEKDEFKARLVKYEPAIKTNILQQLIKGNFSNEAEGKKLIEEAGLYDNDDSLFCVVVVDCFDEFDKSSEIKSSSISYIELMPVIDLVEQVIKGEGNKGQAFQTDYNRIAVILCVKSADRGDINSILSAIKTQAMKDLKLSLVIGTGSIVSRSTGISKSYHVADKMLDWIAFTGDDSEQNIAKFSDADNSHYFYPIQWEERLVNNLKKGDLGAVENIIRELKYENIVKRNLRINVFKRLFVEIIETEMRVIDELNISGIVNEDEYDEVITAGKESELWIFIEKIYRGICLRINAALENSGIELREKIVRYINNNCHNPDISLKNIADKFNLSITNVSVIFKDLTGFNFIDYVTRNRIDESKKLLEKTEDEIQVISGKVGYLSDKTFRRAFKKLEGVSPIEYRQLKRKANRQA